MAGATEAHTQGVGVLFTRGKPGADTGPDSLVDQMGAIMANKPKLIDKLFLWWCKQRYPGGVVVGVIVYGTITVKARSIIFDNMLFVPEGEQPIQKREVN